MEGIDEGNGEDGRVGQDIFVVSSAQIQMRMDGHEGERRGRGQADALKAGMARQRNVRRKGAVIIRKICLIKTAYERGMQGIKRGGAAYARDEDGVLRFSKEGGFLKRQKRRGTAFYAVA